MVWRTVPSPPPPPPPPLRGGGGASPPSSGFLGAGGGLPPPPGPLPWGEGELPPDSGRIFGTRWNAPLPDSGVHQPEQARASTGQHSISAHPPLRCGRRYMRHPARNPLEESRPAPGRIGRG